LDFINAVLLFIVGRSLVFAGEDGPKTAKLRVFAVVLERNWAAGGRGGVGLLGFLSK
jgi:hypothetical protein